MKHTGGGLPLSLFNYVPSLFSYNALHTVPWETTKVLFEPLQAYSSLSMAERRHLLLSTATLRFSERLIDQYDVHSHNM
jgi:hypothetical protein